MENQTTYNGWKNYETYNIALWIQNDEALYHQAVRYQNKGYNDLVKSFEHFFDGIEDLKNKTPDGVLWNDQNLDIGALNKMLEEL